MQKTLTKSGQNNLLPIVGDIVVEVCISLRRSPTLTFQDAKEGESVITFEDRILLRRGVQERILECVRAGSKFDPTTMSPLLELLGTSVTEAIAFREGKLLIAFSNSLKLEIVSTTGYEAWYYQFPRPGRPSGGNHAHHLSLGGADGHLI